MCDSLVTPGVKGLNHKNFGIRRIFLNQKIVNLCTFPNWGHQCLINTLPNLSILAEMKASFGSLTKKNLKYLRDSFLILNY